MISLVLLVVAAAGAAIAVLYTFRPVLSNAHGEVPPTVHDDGAQPHVGEVLRARRDALVTALRELEFDRATGTIAEQDYNRMRGTLTDQAIAVLKQIDGSGASFPVDATVGSGTVAALEGDTTHGRSVPSRAPRMVVSRKLSWLAGGVLVAVAFVLAVLLFTRAARQANNQLAAWSVVPASVSGSLLIDPNDSRRLYYGYSGGVVESRDAGRTWSALEGAPQAVSALIAVDSASPRLIAATTNGLYFSADQGTSWTAAENEPAREIQAAAAGGSALYLLAADGRLLRSDVGGTNWSTIGAPPPAGTDGLAIVGEATLYAATATDGVLATTDNGATWGNANGFVSGALPTLHVHGIVYDPASGDSSVSPGGQRLRGALYTATDRGVYRSVDGGLSWTALGLRTPVIAVSVDPRDSTTMYAVDEQGQVYRSRDKGATWRGS